MLGETELYLNLIFNQNLTETNNNNVGNKS